MSRTNRLEFWRDELGLLPVPLRADGTPDYVMLNGSQGNFCLHVGAASDGEPDFQSLAWSSDVGHFVVVSEALVEVYRWGHVLGHSERFHAALVENRPEDFYQYLETHDPPRSQSIVQHATSAFHGLWNTLRTESGESAIRAFLTLLAAAHDNVELAELNSDVWGLSEASLEVARSIQPGDWEAHRRSLAARPPGSTLTPYIDLLLRHASGLLFQNAHHLAILSPQFTLPGIPVNRLLHMRNLESYSGVFFTPPPLARTLVEVAVNSLDFTKRQLTIFDPACGSAEFLRQALRLLRLRNYPGKIRLIGWDIYPTAIEISRFVLKREYVGLTGERNVEFELQVGDSLDDRPWPNDIDLLLTNPPFVSWDLMSQEQRDRVVAVLGPLSKKKPNMASPFLLRAKQALAADGVLAAVVPSSFMTSESSEPLRRDLATCVHPILLAKLGSQTVFHNAVVDASLFVATRQERTEPTVALWADHRPSSIGAALRGLRRVSIPNAPHLPLDRDGYSIYTAPGLGNTERSWSPTSYQSYAALQSVSSFPKVSELFDVKQGVRLGHDLFVVDLLYYRDLPKQERNYFRPAVMNRSVKQGRLEASDYVFYPNTSGLKEITSERALSEAVPTFYKDRLKPNKETLQSRSSIEESKWWGLIRHRTWIERPTQKIVSTYFGDAGSFAFDASGDFVPVVGNAWMPRRTKLSDPLPHKAWAAYVAILSSEIFSLLLSGVSQHVGGGQWDLSRRFVGNVRMPNLLEPCINPSILGELAKFGDMMASGSNYDGDVLNSVVRVVYGLE